MKTLIFAITLLLGVSSGYAFTGTVLDYLKDGFDAVYKCDMIIKERLQHVRLKFDVHLRKSMHDDPEKFVMYLENAQVNYIDIKARLPAITLPVVFTIQNKKVHQFYATEADTQSEVDVKSAVIAMMFYNVTEQEMENKTKIGSCEMPITHKETEGQFVVEISVKRDECFGKLLIEEVSDSGVTAMDIESGYYFDKATGQLLRSFLKMITEMRAFEMVSVFSIEADFHFNGYKEIREVFDETKNTQMYEKPDAFKNLIQ